MPERQQAKSINPSTVREVVVDPIERQMQAAIDSHDQPAIDRLIHKLRVDPFGDFPGEKSASDQTDQAAVERMISEGSPDSKVD